MSNKFDRSASICSDTCWKVAKDLHNNKIAGYNIYPNNPVKCESPYVRMSDMYLDHPNLRGRPGYGLADDCLIDSYSKLRNDPSTMTHDKCRTQLFSRIFTSGPNLRCGKTNIGSELQLIQGDNTNNVQCRKNIMEEEMNNFIPLLDCVKDIQDPDNIIPTWVNGGEDTRSYINRAEFNKNCNWQGRNRNFST
tara:strand:- start:7623 stop:8201 length:579 start_codon:yes stop_codon:yes gene_type:complete